MGGWVGGGLGVWVSGCRGVSECLGVWVSGSLGVWGWGVGWVVGGVGLGVGVGAGVGLAGGGWRQVGGCRVRLSS